MKNNVSRSLVALYGAWWCDPPGLVQGQSPNSSNYLKVLKT